MSLQGTCSLVNASASNLQIKYELKNTTDKTLYICKYYTPLERICNSGVFIVHDLSKNCELPYWGIMAERVPPRVKDYQKIEPNETVENIVGLSDAFQFVPNQEYSIIAKTKLNVIENLKNMDREISVPCTSNTLTITTI